MKRFTELLKMFWAAIDGNKTLICSVIITIITYAPLPQPYQQILMAIMLAAGGSSLVHHVQKGYFKTTKGH